MKALFVLHLFGQTRHFHSLFQSLVKRGHEVKVLGLHHPDRRELPVKVPKHARHIKGVQYGLTAPQRTDFWAAPIEKFRASRNILFYDHPSMAKGMVFRRRAEGFEDPFLRDLREIRSASARAALQAAYAAIERAFPTDRAVVDQLRAEAADVVLVSPLIFNEMLALNEYVKAAHLIGAPVGFPVFSWDNLTTKGTIHTQPDRIFVWNEIQRKEAIDLHRADPKHVKSFGAWRFDEFFDYKPRFDYHAFCRRNRFDPAERTLLYIGSSPIVAATESDFVDMWVAAVRSAQDPTVRNSNILIRPHPRNELAWWDSLEALKRPRVTIQSIDGLSLFETRDLFDALTNCDAVVGLVTSAMIEAAVVGRPVHTIMTSLAGEGQAGTVHFDYLTEAGGGLLHIAKTLDDHVLALQPHLAAPRGSTDAKAENFLRAFVRPNRDCEPTELLADAIEALATTRKSPRKRGPLDMILEFALKASLKSGALPVGQRPSRVEEIRAARTLQTTR